MKTCRVNVFGDIEWRLDGKLHREDGPAFIFPNGSRAWWLDGKTHRDDGPAVIYPDGYWNGA